MAMCFKTIGTVVFLFFVVVSAQLQGCLRNLRLRRSLVKNQKSSRHLAMSFRSMLCWGTFEREWGDWERENEKDPHLILSLAG
jgi:hypothetical protein